MSRMYDIIQELCRRDGTDVTKMCRALKIPRSTLSELASGRTKQLTLKHARPIAEYFGVTIAQLAGDEPLETEPDQTDAVSDLIRDEPIAAYENLKRYLTEEDKADIATLIRLRAEINQGKLLRGQENILPVARNGACLPVNIQILVMRCGISAVHSHTITSFGGKFQLSIIYKRGM